MDVFLIDSLDLNKQDKQIKFLRQAVSVAGEIVPLEYFDQTPCLELLTHLNIFLRQPVTLLGDLAPHKRFSQTSGIIPLIKSLLTYIRLSR